MKYRRWRFCKDLKLQQQLINSGLGIRTRLIKVFRVSKEMNGYVRIGMIASLRVNGKVICCKLKTLIRINEVPNVGEKVLIRYKTGMLNHVLVSSSAA